jgi:hypothetical protein
LAASQEVLKRPDHVEDEVVLPDPISPRAHSGTSKACHCDVLTVFPALCSNQ